MEKHFEIIYISSVPWDYMWQRPQQLTVAFAEEGKKVLYVEPPISLLSLVKHPLKVKKLFRRRKVLRNISVFSPVVIAPVRVGLFRNINMYFMARQIKKAIEANGFKNPVIITCHAEVAEIIPYFKGHIICYDCVDEASAFPDIPLHVIKQEELLLKEAHILFVTAEKLMVGKGNRHSNVHLVPNGADFNHFARVADISPQDKPEELKNINGPIIGYFGAIASWFDFDLFLGVAKRNPQWTFVLVGPLLTDTPPIPNNVKILGPKDYRDLPKYLRFFDVCTIPFVVNRLTKSTNPVKLYEYLAAGKPVVSTPLPEVTRFNEVVSIVSSVNEFEAAVKKYLAGEDGQLSLARQKVARDNSWKSRSVQILKAVSELMSY
ncbi:glycosyltransferase [Thermincola ferriacetica]